MQIVLINTQLIKEAMEMQDKGFVRLPMVALQDKRLTMSAAAVLAVILDKTDGRSATLPAQQIADAAGVSLRTAKAAIITLEECGYIIVERREGFCSSFQAPDVLPPKRRWKKAPESKQETSIEEYKSVVNKFLY